MLKGHLPKVIHHPVYKYTKTTSTWSGAELRRRRREDETASDSAANRLISKDRNNYPLVQIGRIDGQIPVFEESVKTNLKFEIVGFGLWW